MDKPAEESINRTTITNNGVDFRSPDQKVPRRRFVQSTLFPVNKPDNSGKKEAKNAEEVNVVVDVVDDDDAVECCGSQSGKKKRGRKPKINSQNSTPQKRKPRKVADSGKDDCIVSIDDTESPDDRSPQQLKGKQHTPTRKGRNSVNKRTSLGKTPPRQVSAAHQIPQTVPDLWQEAKKTAEENSRFSAGKQIHPFFSSWKAGKKDQEIIEIDGDRCLVKRKERNAEFNPIHVFEDDKNIVDLNDWSNWTFFDGPFSTTPCNQETNISFFEGAAVSLSFDTGIVSNPRATSLLHKDVSSRQYYGGHEQPLMITSPVSRALVDEKVPRLDLLQNIEKEFEECRFHISGVGDQPDSDLKPENILLDRYLKRSNQPGNSLWTNKYQPEKASEVCGNGEAVKFINDWLQLWHAADFRVRKKARNADNFVKNDEYDSDNSDSDAENADEPPSLKNVLLVSGPVGSGKSAAIYACAKEQGFEVIEVSASDWRSGAVLKQKFGEAVGLHWLKRSQESHAGSQRKLDFKSSPPVLRHRAHTLDLNEDVVEVTSLSEEESGGAGTQTDGDGRICTDQGEIKTLLLFEDVDATLCEDRGLISTIQQLADTGKRPMILTSNNENLELPNNLLREEISFTSLSLKELIRHIYLVCASEKAYIQPHLIERCIDFCGGDIRKSLLLLQFWCQSQVFTEDGKKQSTHSPLVFSLGAMHCTLPKLIPWGLPSSLSVFIEAEISESLSRVEKNQFLFDIVEEDEGNVLNKLDFDKGKAGIIEAKKEAILRGNCFLPVDNDNIVTSLSEFSNCSGSPIAFNRRNTRRRLDIVFSDSDEELMGHRKSTVSNGLSGHSHHILLPAADSHFPVPSPVLEDSSNIVGDHLLNCGTTNVDETRHHFSEAAGANHINSLAVGNSCNQPTDLFVHSDAASFPEIKYHCRQLLDLNNSYCEEPRNSLNKFNEVLSHNQEAQMEVSANQFPPMPHGREEIPAIGIANNHSSDQPSHFGGVKVVEIESSFAANDSLNPLSDQLKRCVQTNTIADRFFFPLIAPADPIGCTIESQRNCSIEGLIHCRGANMTELQDSRTWTNGNQEAVDNSLNQLFEQSSRVKATMENIQQQQPAFTSLNPFSYQTLNVSANSFGDHLSHSVEAKGKGIWHQFTEPGTQTLKFCTTLGGHSSQSNGQCYRPTIAEEIQLRQQQHSGSDYVNNTPCLLPDASLKQIQQTETESVFHQSLKMGNINFTGRLADGNSMGPLGGMALNFIEKKSEQKLQYSDATDVNHMIDRCWSVDVSCVPESTFVPETEMNDGTVGVDEMDIVSPMTTVDVDKSISRLDHPETAQTSLDINVNTRNSDMGDSQSDSEHLEASTSGCHVMDECSRMDFCKKPKRLRSFRSVLKCPVQERWNELRLADLRQNYISEHENAMQILDLAFGVSNLISEGDLLLNDCEFLINDSSNQDTDFSEENFTFGWHDQQVQMASAIAEHGCCLYAKDINALRLKMGTDYTLYLNWELLTSTNNSITLGKLLRLNRSKSPDSLGNRSSTLEARTAGSSMTRVRETHYTNIVRSIAPPRSYLALKGNSLHDYLSSLAHISKSEASRLAEREAAQKTKKRVRATKNYLTSGALDLSPDDISLLNEYNSYSKNSS